MDSLYPLRFEPTFRRYLWGGRRLGEVLQKPIGPGEDYAESWEVVDHGADQSVVRFGPLRGMTLHDIVAAHPDALMGPDPPSRFPLLFKLLDCHRNLSVQVHPNDAQAQLLDAPDLGKTEAWYILDAQPGSRLFAGLKRGFDRAALAREVARGTTELCLHAIEPSPGDCIFIPAGTVHALGAGLLVAEIQQSSDTTFRLFDWNRCGPDGKPRQLHIEQSLDTIDYQRGPVNVQPGRPTGEPGVERLVACDKFVLDRCHFEGEWCWSGDEKFAIVYVVSGAVHLEGEPSGEPLGIGQTVLLPASLRSGTMTATTPTTLLRMSLP